MCTSQVAVVMVPFPEQSHLNSLLELSHILASYNIPVHYAASSTLIRQVTLRRYHNHPNNIHFHGFNLPSFPTTTTTSTTTTTLFPTHLIPVFHASAHLRQPVSHLLQQLSPQYKRVIVIHDCNMASVVQDVKAIVSNAESYSFFGISAFSLFYMFWSGIPDKDKPFQLQLNHSLDIDPARIPADDGFIPPDVMDFVLQQFSFLGLESGRLYNTCRALEGRFMELLEKLTGNNSDIKHFAIGPFNSINLKSSQTQEKERSHECREWLDKQEKEHSVVYISFGSMTSVSDEQNAELAKGLERSGVKFVWVLRKADTADVFAAADDDDDDDGGGGGVTKAWEERMRDRGMVIREWAPQVEILGHRSIGGFMSHCGWNSCIESISMGVPIAAWPMHSEQPKNAFLLSEVLQVGILVPDLGRLAELVTSSRIEEVIKRMMASKQGEEVRKRAVEMGEVVRASVAKDGASSVELDSFLAHITR